MTDTLAATDVPTLIPGWVLDHPDLSYRAVLLYGMLNQIAGVLAAPYGDPSPEALAARLRCSVDEIEAAMNELDAAGAVDIEARRINVYRGRRR